MQDLRWYQGKFPPIKIYPNSLKIRNEAECLPCMYEALGSVPSA